MPKSRLEVLATQRELMGKLHMTITAMDELYTENDWLNEAQPKSISNWLSMSLDELAHAIGLCRNDWDNVLPLDFHITRYGRRTFVRPETPRAEKYLESFKYNERSMGAVVFYEDGKSEDQTIVEMLRINGFAVEVKTETYTG